MMRTGKRRQEAGIGNGIRKRRETAVRLSSAVLAALAVLLFPACSPGGDAENGAKTTDAAGTVGAVEEGMVYVPTFYPLTWPEVEGYYYPADIQLHGDMLYQQRNPLANPVLDTFRAGTGEFLGTITLPVEEGCTLSRYSVDGSGCIYTEESLYLEQEKLMRHYLGKYDGEGKLLWRQDITEPINGQTTVNHVTDMLVDGAGRSYLRCDTRVCFFDESGNYHGEIELQEDGYGNSLRLDADGNVNAVVETVSPAGRGHRLMLLDYEGAGAEVRVQTDGTGQGAGDVYDVGNHIFQTAGPGGRLLMQCPDALRLYDPDTGEARELFTWQDVNVREGSVECAGMLPDGRLMVYITEYENGVCYGEVGVFSQVPEEETVERMQLQFAGIYEADGELERAVYRFNRENPEYHVGMKSYYEYRQDADEYTLMSEAVARMAQDMASGDCPDIISLEGLNIEQMAGRGALTDLAVYLDAPGSRVARADYYEKVLDNYTFGGKLVTIPRGFEFYTLMGKADKLGERTSWTCGDMADFWDVNPEAELLEDMTGEDFAYSCFRFMQGDYVDWKTGSCSFVSPEFLEFLELCSRFPGEDDLPAVEGTRFERYRGDESLLCGQYIGGFEGLQYGEAYFGEPVSYIGYPVREDGVGGGNCMKALDALAIPANSGNKDAAWTFIQSFLEQEGGYTGGFSTNKETMAEWTGYAMQPTDGENGFSEGNTTFYFHAATAEELAQLDALIEHSRALTSEDYQVMLILSEELPAYLSGQKTAKDVAEVIQGRVQLYLDENQ